MTILTFMKISGKLPEMEIFHVNNIYYITGRTIGIFLTCFILDYFKWKWSSGIFIGDNLPIGFPPGKKELSNFLYVKFLGFSVNLIAGYNFLYPFEIVYIWNENFI